MKVYGISKDCMRKESAEGLSYGGTVLLGYGALEEQELEKGIQLLKKAWNSYL